VKITDQIAFRLVLNCEQNGAQDAGAWPHSASEGWIGLWIHPLFFFTLNSSVDDFGGGTIPGGSGMLPAVPGGANPGIRAALSLRLHPVKMAGADWGSMAAPKPAGEKGWVRRRTLAVPPAGQIWRGYYYAGGQRVAMRESTSTTNQVYFLLTDHLGSTTVVTDDQGVVVSKQLDKPWGETRYSSGSLPTTYKYTGQKESASLGLYFYNARWYDSYITQFTQPDTDVPESQGVIGFDRYAYSNNNPLRWT